MENQALEFLEKNNASFGIALDKQKMEVYALLSQSEKDDSVRISLINKLLFILKEVYNNVEEFQSIYNFHELLVSLIIRYCKSHNI